MRHLIAPALVLLLAVIVYNVAGRLSSAYAAGGAGRTMAYTPTVHSAAQLVSGTATPNYDATRGALSIANERAMGELQRTIVAGQATQQVLATDAAIRVIHSALTATATAQAGATARSESGTATAYAPTAVRLQVQSEYQRKYGSFALLADSAGRILLGAGFLLICAGIWWLLRYNAAHEAAKPAAEPERVIRYNPEPVQAAASGEPTQTQDEFIREYVAGYMSRHAGAHVIALPFRAFVREQADGEQPFSRDEFEAWRGWLVERGWAYNAGDDSHIITVLNEAGIAAYA